MPLFHRGIVQIFTSGNKMVQERINLSWSEFETFTSGTLSELFFDKDFVDVTLACVDGHQVKAHKVVLSSCSPFFKTILLANPHTFPLIYLKGVKIGDLQSIIRFIYTGQAEVSQEGVTSFLEAAKELEIKGLAEENIKSKKENHTEPEEKDETSLFKFECDAENDINEEHKNIKVEVDQIDNNLTKLKRCSDGTYECEDCEYRTKHKKHMKTHKLSLHAKVRFECDECIKAFSDPSSLRRHKKSSHEGVRYACDQCCKSATTAFHLVKHKSIKHSL